MWHNYCDPGHPFIMVISEDPWQSHLFLSVKQWSFSLPVFTTKVCRGWDSKTQPSACEANTLTHCATAAVGQNLRSCFQNIHYIIIYENSLGLIYLIFQRLLRRINLRLWIKRTGHIVQMVISCGLYICDEARYIEQWHRLTWEMTLPLKTDCFER